MPLEIEDITIIEIDDARLLPFESVEDAGDVEQPDALALQRQKPPVPRQHRRERFYAMLGDQLPDRLEEPPWPEPTARFGSGPNAWRGTVPRRPPSTVARTALADSDGNAGRHRDPDRAAGRDKRRRLDGTQQVTEGGNDLVERGVRRNQGKLLSAQAAHQSVAGQTLGQDPTDSLKDRVASAVAIGVVHRLEAVDVRDDEHHRL